MCVCFLALWRWHGSVLTCASALESHTHTVVSDVNRHLTMRRGLFYRDRRNLSFPGLVHQYGRCFLKDGSQGLSNGFTNYLNYCLFCLPPPTTTSPPAAPHSQSCVRHLKSILKTKRSSRWRSARWLSDTRGTAHCFWAFIQRPFDLGSRPPSRMRSGRRSSLIWTEQTFHSWCFSILEMGIERW